MWPFFELAGIYFPVYNFLIAVGILLGATELFFAARRKRVMLQFLADNFLWLALATFFSARFFEVLLSNFSFLDFPFFWGGAAGLNFFGAAIGLILVLVFLTHKYNENFFTWLDLIMLSVTPVIITHHIGTFFSGSEYGTPTTLPWGVTFTNPDAVGYSTIPLHPVQIYAVVIVTALFIAACFIFKTTARPGKAGAFLMLTLSIMYFSLDFIRGDSALTLGILRVSQYFTLVFGLIATGLTFKMKAAAREERRGELQIKTPSL
jgi:phosphatidylglycerol:prolipoprotein diacylglycerol transferase